MRLRGRADAVAVAARNVLLGGNLASLQLLRHPRALVRYASENLFLFSALNEKRDIPERNVSYVLPANDEESIVLGNLRAGQRWFFKSTSYGADIVSLCLICRILKPKVGSKSAR